MTIAPFLHEDISTFLALAAAENWISERWELEFLLSRFPQGCFAARDEHGKTAGFATSLKHGRSGWIGNLIVAGECRGQGLGELLFVQTLQALRSEKVETVWLTASDMGKSLYEKHGFRSIDTITRWVGTGLGSAPFHGGGIWDGSDLAPAIDIDSQAWGDQRGQLLATTLERGRMLSSAAGFAGIQPCGDAMQIGPFSSLDGGTAGELFEAALRMIPGDTKVFMDSPDSNRAAGSIFSRNGMRGSGSNQLMCAGEVPDYRPELLYGLATMGSCG
ncbi:MAG: GNAT family N-acetyltransferase [Deltaproteobacteria bacterium]|nr:GNAT family N-acetyltransferase [Deltaproteobacteria bacterium]